MRALDSIVEKGFLQIGDIVSSLNVLQKKSLCLWSGIFRQTQEESIALEKYSLS